MNFWQFIARNHVEVLELTLEHLKLVAFSTGLAVLILGFVWFVFFHT